MNATRAVIDLDDAEGLIAADRAGLMRAASTAGAHVRAIAEAVAEGALESVAGERPRTVIWVAGRGTSATAASLLAATLGTKAGQPFVVASGAPPWIGPLDVLVLAGDESGDPALVGSAAMAVRRGARVVVVAPYEGPLRDATASRAAVLAPRLPVYDAFGLCRYFAAGLATVAAVDDAMQIDVAALADELDAEALRSGATRELFTNPAKALTERMIGRQLVLTADSAAPLALAHHGSAILLRVAGAAAAAACLADALVALASAPVADPVNALFHDEQIDGPLPERFRVLALTLNGERPVVAARVAGHTDIDIVGADDVPDASSVGAGAVEQQLGVLALRLEMAAAYLRLVRG